MSYLAAYHSHKFDHSAVSYEVGINIQTGDFCWWHGPFPAGAYPDINIFRAGLQQMLPAGEVVETDQGYKCAFPDFVNCPPYEHDEQAAMTKTVRLRHETGNRRLKRWGILKDEYRHNIYKHQAVFGAIMCMTQISFENGEPLFPVEYEE